VPTNRPTKYPTTPAPTQPGATNKPSYAPTSTPTIAEHNYATQQSYIDYRKTRSAYNNVTQSFAFGSYYYKSHSIEGTCPQWLSVIHNSLAFPFDDIYFSVLKAEFFRNDYTDGGAYSSYTATCHNPTVIAGIVSSLRSGATFQANCDFFNWRVFTCDSYPVLCVNCKLNCVKTVSCPGASNIVNPCFSGCSARLGAGAAVYFQYANRIFYPQFRSPLPYTATRQSVTLTVNASAVGTVYCAAFSPGAVVNSVVTIRSRGAGSFVSTPYAPVNVTLRGLSPSTSYDVYCYSEDFSSHVMPLQEALRTQQRVTTACCRALELPQRHASIVQYFASSATPEQIFVFALNAPPPSLATVRLTVTPTPCPGSAVATGTADAIAVPAVFTFNYDSSSFTGSFVVRARSVGCYVVAATASGAVQYIAINATVNVRSFRQAPLLPRLLGATLSNDGTKVLVLFDSATNRADTTVKDPSASFPCKALLLFTGAQVSSCYWPTNTQLIATLAGAARPNVTSPVVLLPNMIRANCVAFTNCTLYPYLARQSVPLEAPSDAIVPAVVLQAARTVGGCDDIILDPQRSSGFAGRPWLRMEWTVSGTAGAVNNTPVAAHLNANYTHNTTALVRVPNSLLYRGVDYVFALTLTNFLGRKSTGIVTVAVSSYGVVVPQLRILSASSVTYRWKLITLYASAVFPACALQGSNSPALTYTWKVFKGFTYVAALTSRSLDPRYFKLDAYSLDATAAYTFQVTATVASGSGSSSSTAPALATFTLQVGEAGVAARIAGSAAVTSVVSRPVTLDASVSSDLDYPGTRPLSFAWSCSEVYPSFGASCSSRYLSGDSGSQAVLTLGAFTMTVGTYNFTVLVSNAAGFPSAASVLVQVTNRVVPAVGINSVAAKYNPQDKVILTGSVAATAASGAATAVWSSSSISSLASGNLALTPVSASVPPGAPTVQLAIRPYALSAGLSYTFSLSAGYAGSSDVATCTVTIIMNSPPTGGTVSVAPDTGGVALTTSFLISAYDWYDDVADYPLSYLFTAHTLEQSSSSILKGSDVVSYVNTVLMSGLQGKGYAVTVVAIVTDLYGGSANSSAGVTVLPLATTTAVTLSTAATLQSALLSKDADLITQLVNAAVSTINAVDCAVPTPCASLNRYACRATARTCGACLEGYVGVEGDANIGCRAAGSLVDIGGACSSDGACVSGLCRGRVCAEVSKACPNDCGGHGDCQYSDSNGLSLRNCSVTNSLCKASCACNFGYFGRDCSLSLTKLAVLVQFRETLCGGMYASLALQDVSAETVSSRALTVADMFLDMAQVSDRAYRLCTAVLVDTMRDHPELGCRGASAPLVTSALSSVLDRGNLDTQLLANVSSVLSLISSSCQADLAVGEAPVTIVTSNVRLSTAVASKAALSSGNYSVAVAQSALERFSGAAASTVAVNASQLQDGAALGVALVQYANNPFGALSNSTGVSVQTTVYADASSVDSIDGNRRLAALPADTLDVQVTLLNTRPINYTSRAVSGLLFKCISPRDVPYDVTQYCPPNIPVTLTCPANVKGWSNVTCPGYDTQPVCTTYDGDAYTENENCHVVSYTAEATVCACDGSSASGVAGSMRRRLGQSSAVTQYGSMLKQTNIYLSRIISLIGGN
jgi:hypothetical protein